MPVTICSLIWYQPLNINVKIWTLNPCGIFSFSELFSLNSIFPKIKIPEKAFTFYDRIIEQGLDTLVNRKLEHY